MCQHEFNKEYEAKLTYKVNNPFCYTGSSDIRMLIDQAKEGYARTCKKCGLTEFTTNTKVLKIADFE